jgi:DNA helicase II / ATP-dependent DNA helicase PcrA
LIWDDLTTKQRDAAASEAPIILVLGGAGTGKTTAALWAARRALADEAAETWHRVLFLTFSRSAVEQIASRSARVGGLDDRVEISTFHAFAMRLLRTFGAYAGRGRVLPAIQSEAHRKLFGSDAELLTYDELVPAAIGILEGCQRIRDLAAQRWPLVICDEFQDTSEDQWRLLTLLGQTGRLLLLADPNQMIYTFVHGVGPERLRWARESAETIVELEETSHRDPSGVVPAMASCVRTRDFEAEAVLHALDTGALRVRVAGDDELIQTVVDELRVARDEGSRSVGIYGHSNERVARLGAALTGAGVPHSLIGIPEAQGEGVAAHLVLTRYGLGEATGEEARRALAIFLTACTRGRYAPQLALDLVNDGALPPLFEQRLHEVMADLVEAGRAGLGATAVAAADAWERLQLTRGNVPWRRASYGYLAAVRSVVARRSDAAGTLASLEREVAALRSGALITDGGIRSGLITLMNFHQTKGREADAVQLIYRDGDYLADARDSEPFVEPSRVLYVALTRARRRVAVILPRDPHPLVAPLSEYAV